VRASPRGLRPFRMRSGKTDILDISTGLTGDISIVGGCDQVSSTALNPERWVAELVDIDAGLLKALLSLSRDINGAPCRRIIVTLGRPIGTDDAGVGENVPAKESLPISSASSGALRGRRLLASGQPRTMLFLMGLLKWGM